MFQMLFGRLDFVGFYYHYYYHYYYYYYSMHYIIPRLP